MKNYTEDQVRTMLVECALYVDDAAGRTMLDTTAHRIASRILARSPVGLPVVMDLPKTCRIRARLNRPHRSKR